MKGEAISKDTAVTLYGEQCQRETPLNLRRTR